MATEVDDVGQMKRVDDFDIIFVHPRQSPAAEEAAFFDLTAIDGL